MQFACCFPFLVMLVSVIRTNTLTAVFVVYQYTIGGDARPNVRPKKGKVVFLLDLATAFH